jgi:hypothetical protein
MLISISVDVDWMHLEVGLKWCGLAGCMLRFSLDLEGQSQQRNCPIFLQHFNYGQILEMKITRWRHGLASFGILGGSCRPVFSKSGFFSAPGVRRSQNPAFSALAVSGVLKIHLSRRCQRLVFSKSGFLGALSVRCSQNLAFSVFSASGVFKIRLSQCSQRPAFSELPASGVLKIRLSRGPQRPTFSKSGFLWALSVRRYQNPAFSALSASGVFKIRLSRRSQRSAFSKSGFRNSLAIRRSQNPAFLAFGFLSAFLRFLNLTREPVNTNAFTFQGHCLLSYQEAIKGGSFHRYFSVG